ncbi:DNA mismatch repair endonuclease MutL [Pelagicoccus sp. SDUM812005]|uniref:DNA mismatch repair endonuclease MutL n=1 Tax=Pelagicoccus sp. SDUM812005 TaxID=3041257 RepID=UPI00280C8935|nr:DNA mismatch repair endonuclease MutL [Pelagicoccus sp. SDUM812005]MDQ8181655.1 DNA mismatch repair endonuclease MutL [Pelagicoccus sp. SDUM812005]
MAKVRLLEDHVANQIAAGEVIERPASVVKELVENSIDAGATRIEVEFRNGGTSLMRIEDNGGGMSHDDALLALERHATSKIQKVKDLDGLTTMGFRGEALPSIASVSRFQLQTREEGAEGGTEILIDGGKMVHVRDCGMPQGTRMTISKLFNTVPARRKFLKSKTTESAHIVQCVRLYALAHPEIGFSLLDDGRSLFQSPANSSLKSRIAEVFGKQIANNLIPVDAKEDGIRMHGFIGKPSLSRSSRHEMLFFVNNRPIENKTLSYALVESYYGHIPKGRYPVAFLFLDIDPERVDVNVHPAKREIRFREEAKTRGFAVRTLLEALRTETESYQAIKPVEVRLPKTVEREAEDAVEAVRPKVAAPVPTKAKAKAPAKPARRLVQTVEPEEDAAEAPPAATRIEKVETATPAESVAVKPAAVAVRSSANEPDSEPEAKSKNWNYLGWAQGEFATFDTGAGVVLLNVRAAQQRILYERMIKDFAAKAVRCQKLLLAQPVELDPLSSAVLEESLDFFERLGFEVAPFGRNFFRIEGTPTWLDDAEAEEFVKETIALLRQGNVAEDKEGVAVEMIAKRAAARLRKPREEPSASEIDSLLESLFRCEKPLTDPEGRPSLIEISSGEIDKRFQRRNRRKHDELF